jgi:hypothetical protein
VPQPPVIVPGRATSPSVYQGGNYGELETQSITGFVVGPADAGVGAGQRRAAMYSTVTAGQYDPSSLEMSGSLTGHILSRGIEQSRRRERRQKVRTVLWVGFFLIAFAVAIAVIVDILAGDFIGSLVKTFADFAG